MLHCRTWKRQSEGEVAFKVNAGGRAGACKINCLNTTGMSILVSVQCLAQMGAIIDYSTDAHVQLAKEADGHHYLSLVENLLSRPISDRGQLERLKAAAEKLR